MRLAHEARKAEDSGQIVRAYLLYAEAVARDPHNATYRANRDAIAPAAKLLTKAGIETEDVSNDVREAESNRTNAEPPVEFAKEADWRRDENLQPLPDLRPSTSPATFEIRGDEKSLFQQVTKVYGIRPIFDPQLELHPDLRFNITQADFRTAMEALTAVTQTFVFPISEHDIFVAHDTEMKRNELEPNILLTFPLPNALDQRDLIEAANTVRNALGLHAVGWDSANRMVMIRDRYTRARVARALLEALLLPRPQVSLQLQFLTFDSDVSYHYGVSLPTAFQLIDFGHIGGLRNIIPALASPTNFLSFGGGATLFGFGLTSASLFASYSNAFSQDLFDSTVVVSEGQTANFHVGDKYPIAQTLYTGFSQSAASIYNPTPQITLEDLGLVLKVTPRVNGEGEISLDVEASLKALGTQTFNTIPAIEQREFKGSVSLREGQWAVIAGLDSTTHTKTQNGLIGLGQIPGIGQLLSERTRETTVSNTLVVIKPTITRLPMPATVSPQYLIGPVRGERVLL